MEELYLFQSIEKCHIIRIAAHKKLRADMLTASVDLKFFSGKTTDRSEDPETSARSCFGS